MNTPVSFEIAKLLGVRFYEEAAKMGNTNAMKEKGFNLKLINFYNYDKLSTPFNKDRQVGGLINYNPINWNGSKDHYTSAPTISEVVMWLYKKHGFWIQAPFSHNDIKPFCWIITTTKRNISEEDEDKNCWLSGIDNDNIEGYNSPTKAYEAAIEYVLEKLL